MTDVTDRVDVAVVGAGEAGESVAWRLARRGKKVALAERSLIGGECTYWACVPSKTLLRAPGLRAQARRAYGTGDVSIDFAAVAAYRDYMTRDWDDSKQVREYEDMGVLVMKAQARLEEPGVLVAGDRRVLAADIVVATGSAPFVPPIDGLAEAGHWGTHEVTSMKRPPADIAIIGGGPASIELGQLLARLGTAVTLLVRQPRLLPAEDERIGGALAAALEADGISLRFGVEAGSVSKTARGKRLELTDGSVLEASELLVATGRRPRFGEIGLDAVGVEADRALSTDELGRAGEGLWAVGDVTGVAMLTHVGKYQGRIVTENILGGERKLDYRAVPRVMFSDPEVAFVGVSAEEAKRREIPVLTSTVEMTELARPYIHERDPRGFLTLVVHADTREVLGATAVAPLASEWIHLAALAIRERLSVDSLWESIVQFPTYAEAFIAAAEELKV